MKKSNVITKLCPYMRIGSIRIGSYRVYCTEGEPYHSGRVCALPHLMYPRIDIKAPYVPEDVKAYCPKHYTAKTVYKKIKALEKKMVSEFKKDIYSLDNFNCTY